MDEAKEKMSWDCLSTVLLWYSVRLQIDTAVSGRQCLECVKTTRYDVIFLDHMMPEMDGIETLQNMKLLKDKLNREVPVIMLTANAIVGPRKNIFRQALQTT